MLLIIISRKDSSISHTFQAPEVGTGLPLNCLMGCQTSNSEVSRAGIRDICTSCLCLLLSLDYTSLHPSLGLPLHNSMLKESGWWSARYGGGERGKENMYADGRKAVRENAWRNKSPRHDRRYRGQRGLAVCSFRSRRSWITGAGC